MRWPQTVQAGLGVLVLISLRSFDHRSWEIRVRRRRWGWLVRSLRASVAWREAARLTAVERIPAVSQVSTGPVGGLGKMQARQAVGFAPAGTSLRSPRKSKCGGSSLRSE